MACRVGLLGVVVALLAGCSGGSGGGSASSSVTLDFGATVVSSTSTSAVPVTVESTVPATTEAPTTTTELATTTTLSKEAEVEAAFMQTMAVLVQCGLDPGTCPFSSITVLDSPQDHYLKSSIQQQLDANLRAVAGFGEFRSIVEHVTVGGDLAFVDGCAFNSVVMFDVVDPANPADDIVFDDDVVSSRTRWEMRLVDGVWLLFDGVTQESQRDVDLCGV